MNVTDRSGQTPFAVALRTRDHEAAGAILAREPGAAEQVTETKSNFSGWGGGGGGGEGRAWWWGGREGGLEPQSDERRLLFTG